MQLLERPISERSEPAKEESPIRLSGERRNITARSSEHLVNQTAEDFWDIPAQESFGSDYTELVMKGYARLDFIRRAHEAGTASDQDLAEVEAEVDRLEELEGVQVKQLLESRLLMPLNEGKRLVEETDVLLAKYGDPSSTAS